MVIALAGRRIDKPDTDTPRFPLQNVHLVKKKIKDLFEKLRPQWLVCSAACGSDLIALEVADELKDELNLKFRIVLPFEKAKFLESSVTDRPGDWEEIFNRIYSKAEQSGNVVIIDSNNDDSAYLETNERILDEAELLAEQEINARNLSNRSSDGDVLLVIVWEGSSRGHDDITEAFATSGENRKHKVEEILTK